MEGIKTPLIVAAVAMAATFASVQAAEVKVTFTNNAPGGGTYLTPAWVGFHDGTFDAFSSGAFASAGIEAIAEDGNPGPLIAAFAGAGVDGVVGAAPVAPGASVTNTFSVAEDGSNNYFSFASMVLPSTDYFIGNANPLVTSIAGLLDGTFSSIKIDVVSVYDAGTEVNDFATSAANGLFGIPGGQSGPNEGADEGAFIALVTGIPYDGYANAGGIDLAPFDFSAYDSVASFEIAAVPVPAALPLMLSALGAIGFVKRRRA